jgi:hypothetical protein
MISRRVSRCRYATCSFRDPCRSRQSSPFWYPRAVQPVGDPPLSTDPLCYCYNDLFFDCRFCVPCLFVLERDRSDVVVRLKRILIKLKEAIETGVSSSSRIFWPL